MKNQTVLICKLLFFLVLGHTKELTASVGMLGNNPNPRCTYLELPMTSIKDIFSLPAEEEYLPSPLPYDLGRLKKHLCYSALVMCYHLPKIEKHELQPVIIPDECGDDTLYRLAVYKNGVLLDYLLIHSFWNDHGDIPTFEIIDFSITKDYDITVTEKKRCQGEVQLISSTNYKINSDGKIIKLEE